MRELRGLLSHRTRLVGQRTQARNRLHAVLHRYQIVPPAGALFAAKQRPWWETLSLSTSEQLRVQQDLMLHDTLETLIATVDAAIAEQSASPQWMTPARQLVQLPGIGVLTAMTMLAAIGDWTRFPSAKQLVGYAGLGARVHASGETQRTGRITKEGRRDLRRVLVEAAWIAVGSAGHWKDVFTRLSQRMPPQKAIVAIARKLLVVVWHVLTKPVVDQHGDPALIASALMTWATKHRLARRMGVSRGAFVRRQLDGLGIGTDLTTVRYGGQQAPLPPVGHHHDPPYRSYVRQSVVDPD